MRRLVQFYNSEAKLTQPPTNSPDQLVTFGKARKTDKVMVITIYGHKFSVHILACEVKEKRRRADKEYTRHLCGQASCCNPEHLQFGTPQESAVDSTEHGTCALAKLTTEQVKEIKTALRDDPDVCMAQLSVLYKASKSTIKSINSGKTWKSVSI